MKIKKRYYKVAEKYRAKNYEEALKLLYKIRKDEKDFYYLEGGIYNKLGDFVGEYRALKKLLPMLPRSSQEDKEFYNKCLYNLGNCCSNLGFAEEGLKFYRQVIDTTQNKTRFYNSISNLLFDMIGNENATPADLQSLHEIYRNSFKFEPFERRFYEHDKIRVGLLSGDFYNHVVMKWTWPLFVKLDRSRFEIYCYSNTETELQDEVTKHLRQNVDGWRDIQDIKDEEAAQLIYNDEIDILIDLGGKTSSGRQSVIAYRPATVQIILVGLDSSGLKTMDYFVTDELAFGDSAPYFTENFIVLSTPHICYHPFGEWKLKPASEPPCIKNGYVTFGSFNQYRKITNSMLKTWKKILDAVPNSHLLLKHKTYSLKTNKEFVGNRLKEIGFNLERVELRAYSDKHPLDYNDMDIALDTFPYSGVTTTAESIFMGVPVVSLYGPQHGTRVGLSILTSVGLGELAVASYDDYVKRAVALASDWELLTILKRNLRTMMKNSPFMDEKAYVRELERAFVEVLKAARNPDFSSSGGYSLLLRSLKEQEP